MFDGKRFNTGDPIADYARMAIADNRLAIWAAAMASRFPQSRSFYAPMAARRRKQAETYLSRARRLKQEMTS